MSKTVTVSTSHQLFLAARAAKSGDTILLAAGAYGDAILNNINPAGTVTIRSADPNNDAVFRSLRMTNTSNLHFDDIDVSRPLAAGESLNSTAIQLTKAKNITFTGIDVSGSMDGNAHNDGTGMILTGSRITVLNSTFQQLNTTVSVRGEDFVFAGNTVTNVREGVVINSLNRGIFEQNYMADWQPNFTARDHPDMFQVHSAGGAVASKNLIFRDNVMLPGDKPVGGIFIRSEDAGRGERHENILIENNFYEGAYRHAISVGSVDDAIVRNNTVVMGDHQGLVPAINLNDVRGGLVENNISTMILTPRVDNNSDLVFKGNVNVWDPKDRKGVAASELFAERGDGTIDFGSLNVAQGSVANPGGAGFSAVADIGSLPGSAAAQVAAWLPSFDQQFTVFA